MYFCKKEPIFKWISRICLIFLVFFGFSACAKKGNVENVTIYYGKSDIFDEEEMDEAITVIEDEFKTWQDCTLNAISYISDAESISQLEELNQFSPLDEDARCIVFTSTFHSPVKISRANALGFAADHEYSNWKWVLLKEDNEQDWKIVTYGW